MPLRRHLAWLACAATVACTDRTGYYPDDSFGPWRADVVMSGGDRGVGPGDPAGSGDPSDGGGGDPAGGEPASGDPGANPGDPGGGGDNPSGDSATPVACSHNAECAGTCINGTCDVLAGPDGACDDSFDCITTTDLVCQNAVCVSCLSAFEKCDGVDNNCNGQVNEGCAATCDDLSGVTDDFADGSRGVFWSWTADSGDASFAETGGRLELHTGILGGNYAGYVSPQGYDLRDDSVLVEAAYVDMPAGCQAIMRLATIGWAPVSRVQIRVGGGVWYAEYEVGGVPTVVGSLPYLPSRQRYWRIREYAGTTYWEASADGANFTDSFNMPTPADVEVLQLNLLGSCDVGVTTPGEVHFDNLNGGGFPDGDGTLMPCKAETLVDDFEDGIVARRWGLSFADAGVTRSETSGAASITLPVSSTGYGAFEAVNLYDLTNSEVRVEVAQIASGSAQTYFQLLREGGGNLSFVVQSGNLSMSYDPGTGSVGVGSVAFSGSTDHWRVRESAGTLYFETSGDGVSWTIHDSRPTPMSLTQLRLMLMGGAWEPLASPGAARFATVGVP